MISLEEYQIEYIHLHHTDRPRVIQSISPANIIIFYRESEAIADLYFFLYPNRLYIHFVMFSQ